MFPNKDTGWWYWLAIDLFLIAALSGCPLGFIPAITLGTLQVMHFAARERSFTAFPVQVRVAYLSLLVLGQWEPFHLIYWLQLAGTTAMVLVGYCPLARLLSLLPWNRREPLTWRLVWQTFFSAPSKGNVLQVCRQPRGVSTADNL